jgi:cytochrome c oxidase subunit 2
MKKNSKSTIVSFAAVMAVVVVLVLKFVPADFGFFPENVNSANYGEEVDRLYRTIFVMVTLAFVLTELTLIFCCIHFRNRPGRKAGYSHGSTAAELCWSVIPGVILIWLALTQNKAWQQAKIDFPDESDPSVVVVQVFAEQFQWNFRYPGPDGTFATGDDVVSTNQLYVPINRDILLKMSAKDVIHSFFLPHARVKQDVVPGMMTKVWFSIKKHAVYDVGDIEKQEIKFVTPQELAEMKVAWGGYTFGEVKIDEHGKVLDAERDKTELWKGYKRYFYRLNDNAAEKEPAILNGQVSELPPAQASHVMHYFDIACAELCGLGHYKMKAQLHVVTQGMYDEWLASQKRSMAAEKFENIWDEYFPHYNKVKSKKMKSKTIPALQKPDVTH